MFLGRREIEEREKNYVNEVKRHDNEKTDQITTTSGQLRYLILRNNKSLFQEL